MTSITSGENMTGDQRDPMPSHPFVAGARVAISHRYHDYYTGAFVEKVHKNGNFTLRGGGGQQWRPSSPGPYSDGIWTAHKTGQAGYRTEHLMLWDEKADAKIKAQLAEIEHKKRFNAVRAHFDRLQANDLTPEALDAIVAAIAKATGNGNSE